MEHRLKNFDSIKISLHNITRNKSKSIVHILILSICLSALLLSLFFYFGVIFAKTIAIDDAIENRELFVTVDKSAITNKYSQEKCIALLKKIKHVKYAYKFVPTLPVKTLKNSILKEITYSLKTGSPEHFPDVTFDVTLHGSNVALFPDKIYENQNGTGRSRVIETKKFIGKSIDLYYIYNKNSIRKYTCKISGVYESDNSDNTIYSPLSDLSSITGQIEANSTNNSYTFSVVVDHKKNVSSTIQKIDSSVGYHSKLYKNKISKDSSLYEFAVKFCFIIICTTTILLFLMFSTTVFGKIKNEKKQIALLKAIGYRDFYIYKILLFEILIDSFISYIISIIISSSSYLLFIKPLIMQKNSFSIFKTHSMIANPIPYIFTIIFLIIVPIITCFFAVIKARKISPTILLKE